MEGEDEDVWVIGVSDVEGAVDVGVEEAAVLRSDSISEEDVDADDWVVEAVDVEEVVGWTELSGIDVVDGSPLLDVVIITDDEADEDEGFVEVGGAADDGTDEPAVAGAVVAAAVVSDIAVCEALRVVHTEKPQKLNVDVRRWLLRWLI